MTGLRTALLLSLLFSASIGSAYDSSHLRDFSIKQCIYDVCFEASSALGFVSMAGSQISAASVQLEIRNGEQAEMILCNSFRYSLASQQVFCDNSAIKGRSLSISPTAQRQARIRNFTF